MRHAPLAHSSTSRSQFLPLYPSLHLHTYASTTIVSNEIESSHACPYEHGDAPWPEMCTVLLSLIGTHAPPQDSMPTAEHCSSLQVEGQADCDQADCDQDLSGSRLRRSPSSRKCCSATIVTVSLDVRLVNDTLMISCPTAAGLKVPSASMMAAVKLARKTSKCRGSSDSTHSEHALETVSTPTISAPANSCISEGVHGDVDSSTQEARTSRCFATSTQTNKSTS